MSRIAYVEGCPCSECRDHAIEKAVTAGDIIKAENERRRELAMDEKIAQLKEDLRAGIRNATPGNGVQTDFGTGATRSTAEGKIDYEGHISPRVIRIYGEYMDEHRVQRDGKIRGSDNWQEGIPLARYTKSLIRHVQEFHAMWRGEEVLNLDSGHPFTFKSVLCAILFNTMGIMFEMTRYGTSSLTKFYLTPDERKSLEAQTTVPKRGADIVNISESIRELTGKP